MKIYGRGIKGILLLILFVKSAELFSQNFHVYMSMEMSYNDLYAPGKYQWVARMYIDKAGSGSFNDRRFEDFTADFSYDTMKLKNPRYYVVVNGHPVLSPGLGNYKDTQGQYIVNPVIFTSVKLPVNHVRDSVVVHAYDFSLQDTTYAGANFNYCLSCGEILRIYFDIDSSGSNVPPTYYPNSVDPNPVYWDPTATGYLADTLFDGINMAHHASVPTNPASNPWFKWPYDATGSGSSAGGLGADWDILRGTGGNTSSWNFVGFTGGYLIPLPVEFITFEAMRNGQLINIDWITAEMPEHSYIELEKSADGKLWAGLGKVPGTRGENGLVHFSYTDYNPLNGLNIYRLKQVSDFGKEHYSDLRYVRFLSDDNEDILIYPNPAGEVLNLLMPRIEVPNVMVRLQSAEGRLVLEKMLSSQTSLQLDISGIDSGCYLLTIYWDNKSFVRHIIKTQ